MRARSSLLLITALGAGLLFSGCGMSGSDTESGSVAAQNDAGGAQLAAPEAARDQADGSAAQGKDTPAQAPDLRVDQRSIIYRGSVTVRVKDVNAATGQATGIATTAGGFIGSDNRTSTTNGAGTATLMLRIPADKFGTTVDQLSKLGTEEHREINTEDVTEETVDLDARIAVQQARVDSGRKLLAQAKSLNELVMLEKEVATREADLASLQGKKRRLADLTALSTITVTFLGPDAAAVAPEEPPGFLSGLAAGWDALLASLKVLLTVLGALLPWVIALGLPIWGLLYLYRRLGRGRLGRPALVAATPSATPDTTESTAPKE
ncbi:DUF4349 domain-containing protein [Paractinoplanes rishiriensis]|uniref:Lipoprotein n=1 Tax=Paractinoplanes rishiriensis TaxID=1050105 RepID=A0A919K4G0_9ACTN|nr:DUF4349 domain-containing protein [Actinoplanes rishiriensis]GIE99122.1 lipoprotein [Actinoplanes rishiriensis]